MSSIEIRELVNLIGYEIDQAAQSRAEKSPERVKDRMEAASSATEGFLDRVRKAGQGLTELKQKAEAVFKSLILNFTVPTDEAAKTARAVGVTVGELQKLNYAAQLSGASAADVTKSLGQLAKAGREATKGTKTFKTAFADLGVKVTDGSGKLRSTNDLLLDVADRFAGMKDGSEKTAIAMKLFGRTGATLIPFLSEGRAGLERMGKDAEKLGIVVSDSGAKLAENFNDQLLRAKSAVQGVRNRLALALLPALTDTLQRFTAWITEGDRAQRIFEGIRIAAKGLGLVISFLVSKQISGLILSFGQVAVAAGRAVVGFLAMDAAQKRAAVSAALAKARYLLLLGPLVLIAAAVADLMKLLTGGESEIAKALGPEAAGELKQVVGEIFQTFKELIKEVGPALTELLRAVAPIIPPLAKVLAFIVKIAAKLAKGVVQAFIAIAGAVVEVGGFLKKIWLGALKLIEAAVEKVGRAWETVARIVRPIVDGIRKLWDSTIGWVIEKVGQLIEKMGGLKRIGEIIMIPFKAIRSAIQAIVDFVDSVVKKVSGVWGKIKSFFGGGGEDVGASVSAFRPAPPPGAGEGGITNVAPNVTVNQTVNAAPGMSPEEVSRIANAEAGNVIDGRIRDAVRGNR